MTALVPTGAKAISAASGMHLAGLLITDAASRLRGVSSLRPRGCGIIDPTSMSMRRTTAARRLAAPMAALTSCPAKIGA
jgi:hypothetical protein